MFFRKRDRITQLCRQTGEWVVTAYDKPDLYWIRTLSSRTVYEVGVRQRRNGTSTRFQTWLPMGFRLDRPPDGLAARLMMRSWELTWSAWVASILSSCEFRPCVSVLIPNAALDAGLFHAICREQTEEVAGFHKELRDKFNYTAHFAGGADAPVPCPTGLPQRYR
jgi:hypothetical protein